MPHFPAEFDRLQRRIVARLRRQPPMALASYACALLGLRYAIHDFHQYDYNRFGRSTPLLGVAIVLFILGRGSRRR